MVLAVSQSNPSIPLDGPGWFTRLRLLWVLELEVMGYKGQFGVNLVFVAAGKKAL